MDIDKALNKLEAICLLASSNFPALADLRINVEGDSRGSISISPYALRSVVELAKKAKIGDALKAA